MRVAPVNLKILAYTLEVEGFDAGAVVRRCQLTQEEDLNEEGPWVPVERFDRMMAAAMEETGDRSFGLVAGRSIALMRYGLITPVVLFGPTLRQLLADIAHFAPLMVPRSELELVETGGQARLVVQPVVHGGLSGHFRAEQVATSAVQMIRFASAAGGGGDIDQVDLAYPESDGLAHRYAAAFGSRVRFGQKECAVHFKAALLDARLASHDPVGYMAARTRAEAALASRRARTDVAQRVRQWLLGALPRLPAVQETAEHLGLSERSLRRQLSALGVTHEELVQECQRLTAERLLAEGTLSLTRIADAVGFSSASSFHRAFRRWTGVTPLAWRDDQIA